MKPVMMVMFVSLKFVVSLQEEKSVSRLVVYLFCKQQPLDCQIVFAGVECCWQC